MSRLAANVRFWSIGLLLVALVLAGWSEAVAQEPTVVRVEEDWELVVGDPDPATSTPQVICIISPQGDTNGVYGAFELNARSIPTFEAGGLQLQVWDDEIELSNRRHPNGYLMQESGETVTWTQSMAVDEGALTFDISSGTSSTWGTFGGVGVLRAVVETSLENLDSYDPAVSVANSGVSYAANRVTSLTLKRVRYYMSDDQVIPDDTQRVVHSQAAE
jgi:hypothetical protein